MSSYKVIRKYKTLDGTLIEKVHHFGRDLERARRKFDNSRIGSPERNAAHLLTVSVEFYRDGKCVETNP
jgi:hypothetical protein